MKYYKVKKTGQIFGFEEDGSQDDLIVKGMVKLTTKELDVFLNPPISHEEVKAIEKFWRDSELSRADVEILKVQDGDGVGTEQAWREYRKALRAWPDNEKFPDSVYRPSAPDVAV